MSVIAAYLRNSIFCPEARAVHHRIAVGFIHIYMYIVYISNQSRKNNNAYELHEKTEKWKPNRKIMNVSYLFLVDCQCHVKWRERKRVAKCMLVCARMLGRTCTTVQHEYCRTNGKASSSIEAENVPFNRHRGIVIERQWCIFNTSTHGTGGEAALQHTTAKSKEKLRSTDFSPCSIFTIHSP